MSKNNLLKLIAAVVVSEFAGIIGSLFTVSAINTWYVPLIKPVLNPPAWIFGPVWTILYFLMGVAVFLIWREGLDRKEIRIALSVFSIQLILNALWSIIFFGLHSLAWALVDIVALWFSIIWTITIFYNISRFATYLLIPYFLWVSFASYLNYAIWMLN